MNHVFGKPNMTVSLPVNAKSETLALIEANYKAGNLVAWELTAINCKGERISFIVHECEFDNLVEFVEM